MTVDEILASGRYESRAWGLIERCQEACSGNGLWVCAGHFEPWEHLTTEQVAKAIERDQHRDECPGFGKCASHPVPFVMVFEGSFGVQSAGPLDVDDLKRPMLEDLPEAMDAARALAVGA